MKKVVFFSFKFFVAIAAILISQALCKASAQTTQNQKLSLYAYDSDKHQGDTIIYRHFGDEYDEAEIRKIIDSALSGLDIEMDKMEVLLQEKTNIMEKMNQKIMVFTDSINFDMPDIDSIMKSVNIDIKLDSIQMVVSQEMEEVDELLDNIHQEGNIMWFGDDKEMKVRIIKGSKGEVSIECDGEKITSLDSLGGHMTIFVSDSSSGDIFTTDEDINWMFTDSENPLEGIKTLRLTAVRNKAEDGKKNVEVLVYTTEDGEENHMIKLSEINEDDKKHLRENGLGADGEPLDTDTFIIFPNPGQGHFKLKFYLDKKTRAKIRVIDMEGREVFSKKTVKTKGWVTEEVNLGEKLRGTYFVQIIAGDKTSTKKIMVR